jgi:hypothetical protein
MITELVDQAAVLVTELGETVAALRTALRNSDGTGDDRNEEDGANGSGATSG